MYFGIDIGHNCPPDIGALGGYEDELNKELATKVIAGLVSLGHSVIIVNPQARCSSVSESLITRYLNANTSRVDRLVSFHFNASSGMAYGTKILYATARSKYVADAVLKEILSLKIGICCFYGVGAQQTSYLQLLNGATMPSILIEVCYCDSPRDMEVYERLGSTRVAAAIVKGLTGEYPRLNNRTLRLP